MSESGTIGRALSVHHGAHKRVYDYWNALRNGRLAPQRNEIDPAALRDVLASTMILEWRAKDHLIFRIAGTSICAAFGRELRDHNFIGLWEENSRAQIPILAETLRRDVRAGLIRFSAATLDKAVYMGELLLLPLADSSSTVTRAIGSFYLDRGLDILGFRKLIRLHAEIVESFDPAADQLIVNSQDQVPVSNRPFALVKTRSNNLQAGSDIQTPWSDRLAAFFEPTRK